MRVEGGTAPALTLASAAGAALAPHLVSWTASDVVAVALAAGMRPPGDLAYLYEGAGPRVLPTMGNVICGQWLVPLLDRLGLDRHGAVYRELGVRLHRTIPPEGAATVSGDVVSVDVAGRHARLVVEVDAQTAEAPLATAHAELLIPERGEGGDGARGARPPEGADPADWTAAVRVDPAATAIYRLIFPLRAGIPSADAAHLDPALAARAGWDRPAVHGVSVLGLVVASALRAAPGLRVTGYRARFRRPVAPGDDLRILGGHDGRIVVRAGAERVLDAQLDLREPNP
jgi:hypothetical protein